MPTGADTPPQVLGSASRPRGSKVGRAHGSVAGAISFEANANSDWVVGSFPSRSAATAPSSPRNAAIISRSDRFHSWVRLSDSKGLLAIGCSFSTAKRTPMLPRTMRGRSSDLTVASVSRFQTRVVGSRPDARQNVPAVVLPPSPEHVPQRWSVTSSATPTPANHRNLAIAPKPTQDAV